MRSRLRAITALGLVMVSAGACTGDSADEGRNAGGCTPGAPPRTEAVAAFRVTVTCAEPGPQLTVRHTAQGERILWSTGPGTTPVLSAVRGSTTWTESRGMFTPTSTEQGRTTRQTVDASSRNGDGLTLRGSLLGDGAARPYSLTLTAVADGRLRMSAEVPDADAVVLSAGRDPGERFSGFGAQTPDVDLAGRLVSVVTREQGIGRGDEPVSTLVDTAVPGASGSPDTTYAPVPAWITSARRGFLLEDTDYSTVDLRVAGATTTTVWAPRLTGQVLAGGTPKDLVSRVSEVTGRMAPLAPWAQNGLVAGIQGGTAAVRATVDQLRAAGVPLAGVWLQDWVGSRQTDLGSRLWWDWTLDPTRYPEWDRLVADLRAQDIRVLTYVNPMLTDGRRPGSASPLFEQARSRGFFIRRADGSPYLQDQGGFDAAMVDLSNPAARDWMRGLLVDMARRWGASGWMADFGEGLPFDARLAEGTAAEWHNRYPAAWAELNREAVREAGIEPESVVFSRSAALTSPGAAQMFWTGDQLVTFDRNDGLGSVVPALLNAGVSGMALNSTDIGGYTSLPLPQYQRSAEVLRRWTELAAFTAFFRGHEGSRPVENVQPQETPETAATTARFARVYAALAPYRQQLEAEAAATGLPLVRPLELKYPDDPGSAGIGDQFLLGPDLLVAPVSTAGTTSRSVHLPPGRWELVWDGSGHGDERAGTRVDVPAPLDAPPVFVRGGSELRTVVADAARG